ncbi:S-layer homology domain-containing protein [Paenibacillus sepulcri]|uniref:S-layer homology domain-containing protein n=1 Tax=Paenibacillus sepulcri TaxID=359917 RepID=A0ABS7C0I4_9BACL|nr:S-layer homology domain-containing protein [Paenibacillus sepulcri]
MTWKSKIFFLGLLMTVIISAAGAAAVNGNNVQESSQQRTKQDIMQKWNQYKPMAIGFDYMNTSEIYEMQPALTSPYAAGKLESGYILDGIKAVNFVRYLAGLPDDIQPDWSLQLQQQTTALVNAVNDKLTHTPTRPPDMEEEMFNLGYKGAGSSNLYAGDPTLYSNVLGYMSDSDTSNIDRIGHRRWILNPAMKKTMFGFVPLNSEHLYPYASMYAFNHDRPKAEVSYDYVSWPSSGYFPREIFAPWDAWSVSLNPDIYDNQQTAGIRVTLTRTKDQKTWSFQTLDKDKEGQYMNVETSGFGIPFCIIFRPDKLSEIEDNDQFSVRITGIYDKSGQAAEVNFNTTFFQMLPVVKSRAQEMKLNQGEEVQLATRIKAGTDSAEGAFSFVSENPKVAAVDGQGNIKAEGIGQTRIVLKSYFQDKQTIFVDVVNPDKNKQVSAWALGDYRKAKSNGIISSFFDEAYQEPISRYGFAVMAAQLCENILDRPLESTPTPFKDIDDDYISKAVHAGIIVGTSPDAFAPDQTITRQEAAVMLIRLFDLLNKSVEGTAGAEQDRAISAFADEGQISLWARGQVYRAVELQLMNGTGKGSFDPKGRLTHEQTYIILQHIFESFVKE